MKSHTKNNDIPPAETTERKRGLKAIKIIFYCDRFPATIQQQTCFKTLAYKDDVDRSDRLLPRVIKEEREYSTKVKPYVPRHGQENFPDHGNLEPRRYSPFHHKNQVGTYPTRGQGDSKERINVFLMCY